MITATALVVSYFSGPLLNFGDFSRYGKSMGEIRRGNRWGLPFNFLLFSVVTVVIVSGTQSLFGKMITDRSKPSAAWVTIWRWPSAC
ncbi:cytosine/purine/uracil/thiamine/allantoin permease family protein [Klebsiella pneumoniae]|nr:cytosine/purine/uracil/thiamine/allantoin permease family protein [Klebsiella pneumoniae]